MGQPSINQPSDDEAASLKSISLVLPAWNEAEAIGRAVADACAALSVITGKFEIIVVDDGSTDGTTDVVSRMADENPAVRLVRHDKNQGYGAALRSGFAAARCDLVAFTDADSQFDLTELDRFLLLAKQYEVVCGYRIDRQDTPLRCFYSRVYNLLVRGLLRTGVRDVDCAMKMFHRDVVQSLRITTDGFLVNSELLTQARQQGRSIVEVGVSHRPRTEGQSTVSITHIPAVLASLLRYWWNQVQFPGGDPLASPLAETIGPSGSKEKSYGWAGALLLLVAALLLLTGLAYPLIDQDETRYAEIPREMVATGNWIMPQLNFEPYYDKPPLLYWVCAASYSVFGVSEWSARLVSALCGMGTLLTTLWFGRRMLGQRAALLGSVVLLLSVGFLGCSRILLIDGLLALCSTVSLFAAYEAIRTQKLRLGWWAAASAACGVAFLAKGPLALVLLVPPVFAFTWLAEEVARPRLRHWLILGGIVAAVAAPWFVIVSLQNPSFAYEFFYKHNVTRFAGAFHARPFWYFLPVLMVAGHPWTFLTVPCVGFLASHSEQARRRRYRPLGYLLLWGVWCFAFFSLSSCKLPPYLLPAAPALALMVGSYLDQVLFSADKSRLLEYSRRRAPWLATGMNGLVGAGFGVYVLIAGLEASGIAWTLIACSVVLMIAAFVLSLRQPSARAGWGAAALSALLLASLVFHRELPRYAQAQTVFGPGSPLIAQLNAKDPLVVATVAHEWSGIPFTLVRNDVRHFAKLESPELRAFAAAHPRILIVMRNKQDVTALEDQLPADALLTTIAVRGPARLVMVTAPDKPTAVANTQPPEPGLH